jgi:hypothetical protein
VKDMMIRPKIDHDTTIRSAMTSSIEWNWCKASLSLPSSCREDNLTICRAKKWTSLTSGGQKMTDISMTPPLKPQ